MSDLVFYTNPMSRGQIVRWMLEEIGVDYEQHILPWGKEGSASADYRAINPMSKVPAIVHDGRVVTEAAAIGFYLADTFADAKLGPSSDDERAAYYRWTLFAAGPVEQAVTARSMGWEVGDDPQRQGMVGFGSYDRTMDVLESHLSACHYVCGDRFTMADCYVGSQVMWGLAFGTMPKRPAFETYADRVRQREACKKAKAIDEALIAKMQSN